MELTTLGVVDIVIAFRLVFVLIVVALVIAAMGLTIWALVDVIRRDSIRGDNKIIWVLVILLASIIGPILYLAIGRKKE